MVIAQDSAGRIWLAGKHTLSVYYQGIMRSVPLPAELDQAPISSMIVGRDSALWIVCGKSIASLRGQAWSVYAFGRKSYSANVRQFPAEPRRFLLADSQGRVWVRTLAGLYYVQREGENDAWHPLTTAQIGALTTTQFTTLSSSQIGALKVCICGVTFVTCMESSLPSWAAKSSGPQAGSSRRVM